VLAAWLTLRRQTYLHDLGSVAWTVPPGGLPDVKENDRLKRADLAFKGMFVGPESMVSSSGGWMFASVLDGRFVHFVMPGGGA